MALHFTAYCPPKKSKRKFFFLLFCVYITENIIHSFVLFATMNETQHVNGIYVEGWYSKWDIHYPALWGSTNRKKWQLVYHTNYMPITKSSRNFFVIHKLFFFLFQSRLLFVHSHTHTHIKSIVENMPTKILFFFMEASRKINDFLSVCVCVTSKTFLLYFQPHIKLGHSPPPSQSVWFLRLLSISVRKYRILPKQKKSKTERAA